MSTSVLNVAPCGLRSSRNLGSAQRARKVLSALLLAEGEKGMQWAANWYVKSPQMLRTVIRSPCQQRLAFFCTVCLVSC